MKYLFLFLFLFVNIHAEMSPLVYEKVRNSAPEFLKIEVLSVKTNKKEENILHVDVRARVLKVYRTKSDLKNGDLINISYTIIIHKEMGWVGPSSNILLKTSKKYLAYLKKIDSDKYTTDAYGKSFDTPFINMEKAMEID